MEECKRGGQIPAFGDWDTTNDLPITQYFESARQAGLIRYSGSAPGGATNDLYAVDFIKPTHCSAAVHRQTRGISRRYPHVKEQRKQIKVRDVKDPPRKQPLSHSQNQKHSPKHSNKAVGGYITSQKTTATTTGNVKAVDEDLYKISPELIYTSKREALLTRFKMLTIGLYGVNLDSRGPSDQCPMKECTSYESLLGPDKGMTSFKKVLDCPVFHQLVTK